MGSPEYRAPHYQASDGEDFPRLAKLGEFFVGCAIRKVHRSEARTSFWDSPRMLAQTAVDDKLNEITAMRPLLDPLNLTGTLVNADAMHTQTELATYLVEDKYADYLFIAKGNQPTLEADLRALAPEDFSPSSRTLGKRSRPH